jgi:cysteine synthase
MKLTGDIQADVLAKTVARCRQRGIVVPTFAELRDPRLVPDKVKRRLPGVGLWDFDPLNLFRITWKNDPSTGLFNQGNWLELPSELTGVPARIVGLVGKYFPTGAHKVGAGFGCLAPRLVSGNFDPTSQKAVWPSTGNFCRGGAFDCRLLACTAIAVLPEQMSRERFEWLASAGAEIIATPGCESNVKEIYDTCWELRRTRDDVVVFNQFEELGNAIWHYWTTGGVVEEIFSAIAGPSDRLAAFVSATGSAGTIAAGDYLKKRFPAVRVAAVEALQCPTLLQNGFGGHRIEGIGDKHVPWVHNVRNTDLVVAIDDEAVVSLVRLFNEPVGRASLLHGGLPSGLVDKLGLLGFSGVCNVLSAIKTARFFDLDSHDVLFTPLTDSMDLYGSRIEEQRALHGPYTESQAIRDRARWLDAATTDHMRELGYADRKALHNLKYFTWVEQQGRTVEDLRALWSPDFWEEAWAQVHAWDDLIRSFNQATGVLDAMA